MTEPTRRRPITEMIALNLAIVLALVAALTGVTTFVPDVRRQALTVGCVCGMAAVPLALFSLRRIPRRLRILPIGTAGLAALGALECASMLVV